VIKGPISPSSVTLDQIFFTLLKNKTCLPLVKVTIIQIMNFGLK